LSPEETQPPVERDGVAQAEEDQTVILAVDHRLSDTAPGVDVSEWPAVTSMLHGQTPNSTRAQDIDQTIITNATVQDNIIDPSQPHLRIISCLRTIISRLDAVQSTVNSGMGKAASQENVPISILATHEWLSLVRICVCNFL
jgi:hypothetical protein